MGNQHDHAHRLNPPLRLPGGALLLAMAGLLQAGPIPVPNGSFESPVTPFISLNIAPWQRTPQPDWWNPNTSGDWTTLAGIFKNTPPGSIDHVDNCDGNQAAWLFATPEAGWFQDYQSSPNHDFDARYEVGRSYQLTVGILVGGMSSGGGIKPGATLELSMYYRDAASDQVNVAVTTITNSLSVFSNSTHLLDYSVHVPTVRAEDPWAGQHIGILFLSTVAPELQGGYWDLDNVRLVSVLAPSLADAVHTNGQFQFTLQSEPGMVCEILGSTNLALPASDWVSLATLTNTTGTIPWVDTDANFNQRFFRARQVP